jgi:primosomal protein N' (replication factor Y) (superfamily II helicase)
MKYVDLIIDNKSDQTDTLYTYGCTFEDIQIGQKVVVPFARGNKRKEAYVFDIKDTYDRDVKGLKFVASVDSNICLTPEMIKTIIWLKRRVACRYIDAVRLFTPAGEPSKRGKKREPFLGHEGEHQPIEQLTAEQTNALSKMKAGAEATENKIFLLHGITGSGKTEIYMRAIEACLEKGQTAIMMVPEISLTKQIIDRFIGRFGYETIAVLHSKLSPGERYDEWIRIREGRVNIVIGARSAIFAPLQNIGIIILDEEHESTYKSDMTPKYDTVEVAIKRAKAWDGMVLLGSATPSVVSYYRSCENMYTRIDLEERYNKVPLPQVQVIDMRQELKEGNKTIFSRALYDEMSETLSKGQQIILFLNRRGYATFLSCRECGYVSRCSHCGISLTYHKESNRMSCHYCGYFEAVPKTCPTCGSRYIKFFGTGTEKVEEAVKEYFPEATTARLDLDTIKKKGSLNKILEQFGQGKIQVLTGTQLVAKGLDFRNVGLVGIISADVTLHIPDFRSPERAFQLITQAAGRAGRGEEPGKVVIQTYTPENYAIEAAGAQDYARFYETEIKLREYMEYPPFSDLIQVTFEAETEEDACNAANEWNRGLLGILGPDQAERIFPPQSAGKMRDRENYRYYMIIKSPPGKRNLFMNALEQLKETKNMEKRCRYQVSTDVNPYSIWRS